MDTSELADATPATGIVWAYRFQPDGTSEPIAPAKIESALTKLSSGWLWLHLASRIRVAATGLPNTRQFRNWRVKSSAARIVTCVSTFLARKLSAWCRIYTRSLRSREKTLCVCVS